MKTFIIKTYFKNILFVPPFKGTVICFFLVNLSFLCKGFAKNDRLSICGTEILNTSAINVSDLQPISFTQLKEKDKILDKLAVLSKDIQNLLDKNKEDIFPKSLAIFSEHVPGLIGDSNNIYLTILSKINESLKGIKTQISFSARISILPEKLCQSMYKMTNKRLKQLNEMVSKNIKIDLPHSESFSTQEFNRNSNAAWIPQTKNKIEGISFNINYKTDLNQDQKKAIYETEISGGIIISVPKHFSLPLNIPLYLQNLPTLILKDAFFEYSPKYPDRKHYITMNIDKVVFTNKVDPVINILNTSNYPEIHVFFSDEVHYDLRYLSRFLNFTPSIERPLGSLLGQIVLEKCEKMMAAPPSRSIMTNFWVKACDHSARLNLALNHLVINFVPTKLKEVGNSEATIVLLPQIRAPNPNKGEVGGVKFLPRYYNPLGNAKDRPEMKLFSFYLNSTKYVKTVFDQGLDIVNFTLKNNAVGVLSVLNEMKKNILYANFKIKSSHINAKEIPEEEEKPSFTLPKRTHDISKD